MKYKDAVSPYGLKMIAGLCKDGFSDKEIAERIGITNVTLCHWRQRNPKIRATMDTARGKMTMAMPQTGQTKEVRDLRALNKRAHRPVVGRDAWNVNTVRDVISQWQYERKRDKLPLTIESLCQMLGLSISDYRKIIEDKITLKADADEMALNPVTNTIQPAIVDMLKSANRAVLSELADKALMKNSNGAIFLLKNHYNYTDKQTLDVSDNSYTVRWEPTGDGKTYVLKEPVRDIET